MRRQLPSCSSLVLAAPLAAQRGAASVSPQDAGARSGTPSTSRRRCRRCSTTPRSCKRLDGRRAGDAGSLHGWRRSASRSRGARSTTSRPAPARSACCCGRRCTATSRPRPRRCSTSSSTCAATARSRWCGGILSTLTLHVVPMLNPDGAERFQRRNAQSIDINRDALRLQTPEGRALKALRDRLQPARRLQPAQSELAHVGGHAAEAGVDLAAVGRLRRGAQRERRAQRSPRRSAR